MSQPVKDSIFKEHDFEDVLVLDGATDDIKKAVNLTTNETLVQEDSPSGPSGQLGQTPARGRAQFRGGILTQNDTTFNEPINVTRNRTILPASVYVRQKEAEAKQREPQTGAASSGNVSAKRNENLVSQMNSPNICATDLNETMNEAASDYDPAFQVERPSTPDPNVK